MDIAGLIASFATGTYTVTRRGPSEVVRGRVQEPSSSTFTIVAAISPASGRDLERLPEGRMDSETRTLFTATELRVGGQDQPYQADLVTVDGVQWEVQHAETWTHPGGATKGYKCLIQRP